MWRAMPHGPGPAMEAPGDFPDLVCLCGSHWPSRRLGRQSPGPPWTSSACTCSHDGVHSLLREHLALSLSHCLSVSHTHIPTAVAAVIHYHLPTLPSIASICLLPPFQFASCRPKTAAKPLFNPQAADGLSHAPVIINTVLVRHCVHAESMCILQTRLPLLAMSTMRLAPLLPSYTPR